MTVISKLFKKINEDNFDDIAKLFKIDRKVLDQLDKWHKKYVPDSGTASSVGGNMVRNLETVLYRFHNDGDIVGIRGRDPSKKVNPAASALTKSLYSLAEALGIPFDDPDFEQAVKPIFRNSVKDEDKYRLMLGRTAEYIVNLLNKAESLDVFSSKSIKPRRSNTRHW